MFQRPLTLILLKKYHDTNVRRIAIQIGGVYGTFCQEEGILLPKYRDRNGRCVAILSSKVSGSGVNRIFLSLVARAIRNAIRANRFARIIRNWHPYFYSVSCQLRTNHSIRANHATWILLSFTCPQFRAEKTMTATDVTGFDAIFSTGFFATFSRF